MQEEQKVISLDEEIQREAHAILEKMEEGTINAAYGGEMFKKLSAAALNGWFPDSELSQENVEQFSGRAHWHFNNILSREVQQRRLENDIALCLDLSAKEFFGNVTHFAPQNDFAALLFNEAELLLNKAEEAGPDNADHSYAARAFHRLAEAWLQHESPDIELDCDIGAVAQTAEEHFKRRIPFFHQASMAQLMDVCLREAFKEEGRKIVFPVWDYAATLEPKEEKLEDYESGYDPLRLHKFTQQVLTKGVLRVRGDDNEIFRAIWQFNLTLFPEAFTRQEFIESLSALPDEMRDLEVADFDAALAAQQEQTPEVVARLLLQSRNRLVRAYTGAVYQEFIELGDLGIRCGISATLFLAALYSKSRYARTKGAPKEVVERARPTLTDLKKSVVAYFVDWLTQPLATRPKGGKKAKADRVKTTLSAEYEHIVKDWHEVSQIYKDATHSRSDIRKNGWRSEIKRCFSLLDMPDDLVERLQPRLFWPVEISEVACKQGHDSSDSDDIALEHAARLCGAGKYDYKLSTLKQYLRTQRRREISNVETEIPMTADDTKI